MFCIAFKMFKIKYLQRISSAPVVLWLLLFAPSINGQDYLDLDHHSLVDHFSSVVASSRRGESGSSSAVFNVNEVPRLPTWNAAPPDSDSRPIDFTQLFNMMGEPRGSRGRDVSDLISRPRPRCNRRIRVLNGVTRIRERGSLARFQCSHGYTLIGPTTIVCLRNQWSEPPPICVKGGCRPIRRPQGADVRQSVGGAVVGFYCSPGTTLVGDPILFCDGIRWNGTEPTCRPDATTTPEPESEEEWPASVATPSFLNTTEGVTEQEENWDNNAETEKSDLEATTETEHRHPLPHQTQGPSIVIPAVTVPATPKVERVTEEQRVPEAVTESAVSPGLPEDTVKTEQHHEVPAPVTTEKPVNHTQKMGHSSTPPVTISTTLKTLRPPTKPSPQPLVTTNPPIPPFITTHLPLTPVPRIVPSTTKPSTTLITIKPTTVAPPKTPAIATQPPLVTTKPPLEPEPEPTFIPSTTPAPRRVTPRRRFKILTKRPRRPPTRRPGRRPSWRRTTTTIKPRKPNFPTILVPATTPPPPPPIQTTASTTTTSTPVPPVPEMPLEEPQDNAPSISKDYPIAIDKEFLPREHVEPVRPIIFPDMLNNDILHKYKTGGGDGGGSHVSMIIGIVVVALGLVSFSGGVVLYCWRKNKGIARARPYDMDGRTLSAHDANDDFMWMDQRDTVL